MTVEAERNVSYRVGGELPDEELNRFYSACWPDHVPQSYQQVLDHSLLFVTARSGGQLVGFVNMAWDGGEHAFLLDTLVRPDVRRNGIGTELCKRAVEAARSYNIKWVHVDFEPHLQRFYAECGFRPTEAGLIKLRM